MKKTKLAVRCAECKTVIISASRHDFVWCSCGETFVDGGDDYCRMGGHPETVKITQEEYDRIKQQKNK